MNEQKYNTFLLKAFASVFLFASGAASVFALPGFVVDGSNATNSTGPCTGKTVCHISGNLTYSDITVVNGGKLSHRQGTLTVSNNMILGGTGSTGSGFFVGQNTIVGNQLSIAGDSVMALNSNLTSDPAGANITDWMGTTYYDLQVANTNLSFTGMSVSLATGCTTAGGGTTLSACIQTRNVNVNSMLAITGGATNVVWKTYANGYLAVDSDATFTNIKMDVDGYVYVQGNVYGSFNNAHYFYVNGGQQVATPDAIGFTTAGFRVDGNMTLTGSASLPDFYMSGATTTAWDNLYVSGSLFTTQMSLGMTSKTTQQSLGNIAVKNGILSIVNSDTVYFNGNMYVGSNATFTNDTTIDGNNVTSNNGNIVVTTGTTHSLGVVTVTNGTLTLSGITTLNRNGNITAKSDISFTNITTSSGVATNVASTNGNITTLNGTTQTYQDISAFGNLSFSGITTRLDTRAISNSGATTFTNVLLHNRLWDIVTTGDITATNITTSSGSATNVTSTAWNIVVTTGTAHTYNHITAYKDNSVTNITSYNADNIATNGAFIMIGSTITITNLEDATDENKQNLDITTGSGFVITNSTANLENSSIQTNGYLEVNNTAWKSQNLNINGYATLSGERVSVYFRWGKDRTILGTIFAGGGSIWVGTSAIPDDGNIFLKRKAGITTNANIKVYRSTTSAIDSSATPPETTPTVNTGLFTQLYNPALLSLSGSVTVITGSATNKDYLIDGNTATFYESNTPGSAFRVDFARDMIISKLCVTAGTNEPDNLKLQFMDAGGTIINTQAQKMPTTGQPRKCFDLNSYKARKILVTGYGASSTLGFGEIEFFGVPADTANIAAPFGNDIVLQNGTYEFGWVLTSGNLNASSQTSKILKATQYHNNAPFNHKNSIVLAAATAGGTTFTHSVGNEAGLRFITDTMNVGTNVLVDVAGKGYLGGNANGEPSNATSTGSLYPFSSFKFTNCGQTWYTWPTLTTCRAAAGYAGVSWVQDTVNNYFSVPTTGIQEWVVPITGTYTIDAAGAWYPTYGGGGARISWDIALTKWQKLRILVGQQGQNDKGSAITGAGGTFVTTSSNSPLIVAWGGGGSYYQWQNYQYSGGQTTTSGGGAYEYGGQWITGWAGGAGGSCGSSYTTCQGGGGGFTWNGNGSGYGYSFTNGWNGGCYSYCGGFGGGGGTTSWYGGGGGGYSGGGAGYNGSNQNYSFAGGGGSYVSGTNQTIKAGENGGMGFVNITYIAPPPSTNGWVGNITPGSQKIGAGDGWLSGGFGGYGVSGGGGGGAGALYSFSSFTFTNCGASWATGPSLASCRSSYGAVPWVQDTTNNFLNMTTNGIQEWTVPLTWTYSVDAYGAWWPNYGGGWARIKGDLVLFRWQKLKILVGQQWSTNSNSSATPGNGGTFIVTSSNDPLIVAWGGGGGYYPTQNYQESGWRITTNGGGCNQNTNANPHYMWGIGGNGAPAADSSNGCAWAGLFTNGYCPSTAAQSFINGGVGWSWSYQWGFGWGGGTTSWGGGGGGGYSGGAGCYGGSYQSYAYGWGGGSYNAWTNQINTSGANAWQGYVTITYTSGTTVWGNAAAAGAGNLGYGGYGGSTTCTGSLGNNSLGNTKWGNGGGPLGGSGSNWHGGGGAVWCTGGGGGTGGNSDSNPYRLGSGGGAGGLMVNDYTHGYGGNGGGMIRISSNTLVLSGSLLASGYVGKDYQATTTAISWAGAGGAGGSILIRAKSLTCVTGNSIEVKWGNGGAGWSNTGGGGGGGGGVITYYYTNKTGTCNGALTAGAGGASGGAAGGQDGKIYESVGTTFDTLKSRVTIENSPAAADGTQAVTVRAYFLDVNGVPLEGEYLVAEVVGDLGTGKINGGSPLPQTDANGMLSFPITSTVKGIKKIILKNALTYTELQEQPTLTFGIPQVSIAKTADKSTVNSGDTVTYTITLTNSGSGDAGGDPENAIVVEDVLPTGFMYNTTGPTAGSKWDTGSGTVQSYIFPEVTGDGTAGNEQRLRYTITDGLSGPANIPSGGGKVRIVFDTKAP